jgi:S-adenosylmethionine:tRNA ribosyltransferase-isomerase
MKNIDINEYDYNLPEDKIAQYPVSERDMSKLLIYKECRISKDIFTNISDYIPPDSLLVFNNSRVIHARLIFNKDTGAKIEILCLEPISPVDYEESLRSTETVEWNCIVGNLKKWKRGKIYIPFIYRGKNFILAAEKLSQENESCRVRFTWNCRNLSFSDLIESTGHIPLPPYITREDEADDKKRYQTIYSRVNGSVAAPTAGLHFTDSVVEKLKGKGINSVWITLHVGAGTFLPIKAGRINEHTMHSEQFFVTKDTIKLLLSYHGKIIPVGTTSARTLESLYWLGVKLIEIPNNLISCLSLEQWEPYYMRSDITVNDSLNALLNYLNNHKFTSVNARTSLMIIPGYNFRMINGIVTNFHQPKSTLLLLISALVGTTWKDIYKFALENNFRFLSYGDSSFLLK